MCCSAVVLCVALHAVSIRAREARASGMSQCPCKALAGCTHMYSKSRSNCPSLGQILRDLEYMCVHAARGAIGRTILAPQLAGASPAARLHARVGCLKGSWPRAPLLMTPHYNHWWRCDSRTRIEHTCAVFITISPDGHMLRVWSATWH